MNILEGAEVDLNWRNLKQAQQRAHISHIISQREFQKFRLNYLANVLMKFSEHLATAAAIHYLTTDGSNRIFSHLKPLWQSLTFSQFSPL